MYKKLFRTSLVLLILFSTHAYAKKTTNIDKEVAETAGFQWTSLYAGVNGGGAWEKLHNRLALVDNPTNPYFFPLAIPGINATGSTRLDQDNGAIGGQVGYNKQFDHFLIGLELSYDYLNAKKTYGGSFLYTTNLSPYLLNETATTDYLFTVRPRLGIVDQNALFYFTGGLALAREKFMQNFAEPPFTTVPAEFTTFSKTQTGWTVGGGLEYALYNNWSLKGEYLFNRFNGETQAGQLSTVFGGATFINSLSYRDVHAFTAGINYHFS